MYIIESVVKQTNPNYTSFELRKDLAMMCFVVVAG